MNEQIIDTVVSPEADKQLESLQAELKATTKDFIDTAKAAAQLLAVTGGAKTFAQFEKSAQQAAIATQKLAQEQGKAAIVAANLTKAQAQAQAAIDRQTVAQTRATDVVAKSLSPYQQLSKELDIQRAKAKDLAIEYGEGSIKFKEAAAEVSALDARLKGIDNTLGQSQRNVGNYAGGIVEGFGKVYSVVRQAAFILPGIGISGIFLAIFEGIKDVAEELGIFSSKITVAAEATKAFNNISKDANQEIADQSTRLKILYEASTDVTNSTKDRTDAAKELQKEFPETFANIEREIILNGGSKDAYDELTKSIIKSARARAAVVELQKQEATILSADIQIQKINNARQAELDREKNKPEVEGITGRTQEQIINDRADKAIEAQNRIKQSAEGTKKVIDQLFGTSKDLAKGLITKEPNGTEKNQSSNDKDESEIIKLNASIQAEKMISDNQKNALGYRKLNLEFALDDEIKIIEINKAKQLREVNLTEQQRQNIIDQSNLDILTKQREYEKQIEDLKDPKKAAAKKGKTPQELLKEQLEAQKHVEDGVLANENSTYDRRLDAIETYETKSNQLLEKAQKDKVLSERETNNEVLKVGTDAGKDRLKVQQDAAKKLLDSLKQGASDQDKILQQQVSDIKDALDTQLVTIDKNKSDQILAQSDLYAKGEINALQYNQNLYNIDAQATSDRLQAQIKATQQIISLRKEDAQYGIGAAKDLQQAQNDLTKLQIQASDLGAKTELDNIKKIEDARKQLHETEKQIASASIDLIKDVIDNGYKRQLDALKDQSDQVSENADNEKKVVENSLDTADNKARREAIIDAQATAKKEELANKEKEIQKEQAKIDAIASEAKIIGATAATIFQLEAQAAIATAQGAVLLSNPLTALYAPVAFAAAATISAEIPAVLALAAIQTAATLIPAFEDGVKGFSGGIAIVGEAGRERIDTVNGSFLSPDVATMMYLPPGTDVTPHAQTMAQIRPENLDRYHVRESVPWRDVIRAIERNKPIEQKQQRQLGSKDIARALAQSEYERRIFK